MCLLPNLYKVFSGVLLMEVQFWCFATLLKSHFCIQACNFIKRETLAQVFSCEFYEIAKNTFFTEHLWMTASECGITSNVRVPVGLLLITEAYSESCQTSEIELFAKVVNDFCVKYFCKKASS